MVPAGSSGRWRVPSNGPRFRVRVGEYGAHARHLAGLPHIDLLDGGMWVRAAQGGRIQHIRQAHIRGKTALPLTVRRRRCGGWACRQWWFRPKVSQSVRPWLISPPFAIPRHAGRRGRCGCKRRSGTGCRSPLHGSARRWAGASSAKAPRRPPPVPECSSRTGARLFHEGLLHGAELFAVHQALDGGDFGAHGFQGQRQAGIPGYAIDQNGAGAALAALAAGLGPVRPRRSCNTCWRVQRGSTAKE